MPRTHSVRARPAAKEGSPRALRALTIDVDTPATMPAASSSSRDHALRKRSGLTVIHTGAVSPIVRTGEAPRAIVSFVSLDPSTVTAAHPASAALPSTGSRDRLTPAAVAAVRAAHVVVVGETSARTPLARELPRADSHSGPLHAPTGAGWMHAAACELDSARGPAMSAHRTDDFHELSPMLHATAAAGSSSHPLRGLASSRVRPQSVRSQGAPALLTPLASLVASGTPRRFASLTRTPSASTNGSRGPDAVHVAPDAGQEVPPPPSARLAHPPAPVPLCSVSCAPLMPAHAAGNIRVGALARLWHSALADGASELVDARAAVARWLNGHSPAKGGGNDADGGNAADDDSSDAGSEPELPLLDITMVPGGEHSPAASPRADAEGEPETGTVYVRTLNDAEAAVARAATLCDLQMAQQCAKLRALGHPSAMQAAALLMAAHRDAGSDFARAMEEARQRESKLRRYTDELLDLEQQLRMALEKANVELEAAAEEAARASGKWI